MPTPMLMAIGREIVRDNEACFLFVLLTESGLGYVLIYSFLAFHIICTYRIHGLSVEGI